MNRIPPPSSRPKSTCHSRVAVWTLPDPAEVEHLAYSVWLHEGAQPGLEARFQREVAFQLQHTRHLLARELSSPFDDRRPAGLTA
jgi:hypothetical protein